MTVPDESTDDAVVADEDVVDAAVLSAEDLPNPPLAEGEGGEPPTAHASEQSPDEVAAERDQYLDALRRTQADFENFRKRSLKQQGDAVEQATGRLAEDLLPVLDACDAAVLHGIDEVDAVVSALVGTLERAGLARIAPSGEPFDPNAHDAVLHEPADDTTAEPTVVEVLRPGYAWKGRVIRPAMVKVKG